jgi:hypothetical protein
MEITKQFIISDLGREYDTTQMPAVIGLQPDQAREESDADTRIATSSVSFFKTCP